MVQFDGHLPYLLVMFGKRSKRQEPARPSGPQGKRAYAIGDVHGCLSELDALLTLIGDDLSRRSEKQTFLVFLGDLIDRGPDSRGVIDRLRDEPLTGARPVFLMGNHEESMLRGLRGEPNLLKPWLEHGGYACAESYGVPRHVIAGLPSEAIEHELLSAVPQSHLDFLSTFVDSVTFGDFLFVHAGLRPGVPLEAQSPADMRWIRQAFLESEENFGKMVVHGHSVTETVTWRANRIGIDTGAYQSGILSCLRIEDEDLSLLQTRG